jgi:RNA polymerase sigma-70 factor, ECF subfamily
MDERTRRERAWQRAALAGDADAWLALYDDAFAALDTYVLWRCGGLRDLADDISQDVWLTAVRRLAAFDPARAPFLAWLRGIAAGLLRNRFRLRARRDRLRPPGAAAAAAPAADAEAERRERALRVARTLADLPERYEAVLRARYLEGRAVADMAADQGETAKAVESVLSRARQAFRDAYGGDTP